MERIRPFPAAAAAVILVILSAAFPLAGQEGTPGERTPAAPPAQGAAPVRTHRLQVVANVPEARIFVDGSYRGTAPGTVELRPGRYEVQVTAPGFEAFRTRVDLFGDRTVQAELARETRALRVTGNIPGARVYAGGEFLGTAPGTFELPPGNYPIRVTAPGYREFVLAVNLFGNREISYVLQQELHRLSVSADVPGARVLIDGEDRGTAPLTVTLPRGSHDIRVTAPGYFEYRTSLQLDRSETIRARLSPAAATITIRIPERFMDPRNRSAASQIQVFVDEVRMMKPTFTLPAGAHTIRFTSGGFFVEERFDFSAGLRYLVEPFLDLRIE